MGGVILLLVNDGIMRVLPWNDQAVLNQRSEISMYLFVAQTSFFWAWLWVHRNFRYHDLRIIQHTREKEWVVFLRALEETNSSRMCKVCRYLYIYMYTWPEIFHRDRYLKMMVWKRWRSLWNTWHHFGNLAVQFRGRFLYCSSWAERLPRSLVLFEILSSFPCSFITYISSWYIIVP